MEWSGFGACITKLLNMECMGFKYLKDMIMMIWKWRMRRRKESTPIVATRLIRNYTILVLLPNQTKLLFPSPLHWFIHMSWSFKCWCIYHFWRCLELVVKSVHGVEKISRIFSFGFHWFLFLGRLYPFLQNWNNYWLRQLALSDFLNILDLDLAFGYSIGILKMSSFSILQILDSSIHDTNFPLLPLLATLWLISFGNNLWLEGFKSEKLCISREIRYTFVSKKES